MKLINNKFVCIVFVMITLAAYQSILLAKENNFLLDEQTHTALTDIQKDMEEGRNETALKKLKKLAVSDNIKDYDLAVIYQTMGYAENGLNNFKNSAKYFVKALSFNALPDKVTHELQYSTAQLLIHIEKPKEGLIYLSKWFTTETNPKADAHILAATAYYYTEDYQQLIVHAKKALLKNPKPPINWYELLLAGYYELKDYKNAADVLENIISEYPEKSSYWLQLAGIYQQLKKDKKALAIYELAYTKELLKKDEIIQLIKNYRYMEMPYKAANLLEKEMAIGDIEANKEMLILLADSWILAQENNKAKSVFKELINKFNDDTARLRLGQLLLDDEEWQDAVDVLNIKPQTKDKTLISKINLLLGIAQYHTDNLSDATRAFTNSLSDASTKDQAQWWLQHLKKKSETQQKS